MNAIYNIVHSPLFPYAFALVLGIPIIVLLRHYVFRMIALKERELKNMAVQQSAEARNQALERMVLFLERIKPAVLVTKFDNSLTPSEFFFLADRQIQEEFEYNSSQQLYLSKAAWESIVLAKNNVRELLATSLAGISAATTLEEYKTVTLLNYMKGEDSVTNAVDALRAELLLLQKL